TVAASSGQLPEGETMVRRRSRPLRSAAGAVVVVTLSLGGCTPDEPVTPDEPTTPTEDGCQADAEEGFRPLFDGTQQSLDSWRMAGPGSFELAEDCSARTVGGM